jgi:hypothetical protein
MYGMVRARKSLSLYLFSLYLFLSFFFLTNSFYLEGFFLCNFRVSALFFDSYTKNQKQKAAQNHHKQQQKMVSSSSSSSFEENASLPSLIAFGFAYGLAHVLSGPDHVIALAVIASSSSSTTTTTTNASSEKSSPISNSDDDEEEEQSAFAIDDRRKADEYEDEDENDEERATSSSSFVSDDERRRRRRGRRENILLGFSWAVGHSLGLSFLVCLFFALKRELNVSAIGDVGDKIVGFTMLCVAFAAARGAKKFREREKAEKEHVRDDKAEGEGEEKAHAGDEVVLEIDPTVFGARVVTSGSKEHEEMHARREPHVHQSKRGGEDEDDCGDKAEIIADEGEPKREDDDHQKPISKNNSLCFDDDEDDATKTTTAAEKKKKKKKKKKTKDASTGDKAKKSAFLVGLVHGVSGVSGILGVLPGVVLNSSSKSAAFIVSFLLCSTFAMTLFSVLFGETLRKAAALAQGDGGRRKKLADANLVVFWVNVFFAVGAFACGCAWLYLSFSGKGVDV